MDTIGVRGHAMEGFPSAKGSVHQQRGKSVGLIDTIMSALNAHRIA
jgi:hypothetical protein